MNRILVTALGVSLIGVAGLGVAQWREAQSLRDELAALDRERAELRKKLWDAERRSSEIAQTAPISVTVSGSGESAAAATGDAAEGRRGPRRNFGEMAGRAMAVLDSPDAQRLMAIQQKGALDSRYAALFRQLNLPPEQLDRLKSLLVERQTAALDVVAAARTEGMNPFENAGEYRALVQAAQKDIDASIRATLGDSVYNQYQSYENSLAHRGVVSQLEQRLSYSTMPLNRQQTEQLVQILAATVPSTGNSAGGGPRTRAFAVGPGASFTANTGGVTLTDDAIANASTVLAPAQVAALQQIQQEQQAQAQLAGQMRATFGRRDRPPDGG